MAPTWKEHSFASLRPGMILSSMGGHRWKIRAIHGFTLTVVDMETGSETTVIVHAHRMGWVYVEHQGTMYIAEA
jgi:hypothetical protein